MFSDPGQDVKGTAGVGIIRGPGQSNFNINLAKEFRPTERMGVEFHADLYNKVNHTRFGNLNTDFEEFSGTTLRVGHMGARCSTRDADGIASRVLAITPRVDQESVSFGGTFPALFLCFLLTL